MTAENDLVTIALGGSRSRGNATATSDFDLFVTIKDDAFVHWRRDLPSRAYTWDSNTIFASFNRFILGWGYLYGVLTTEHYFDIAIVRLSQMDDLGILSTNQIIKDSPDGILSNAIKHADDTKHDARFLLINNQEAIEGQFLIYCYRFMRAANAKHKLLMVRDLQFLRNSLLMTYRISRAEYGAIYTSPEKGYISKPFELELSANFCIDDDYNTLLQTYKWLVEAFLRYCSNPSGKQSTINTINQHPLMTSS